MKLPIVLAVYCRKRCSDYPTNILDPRIKRNANGIPAEFHHLRSDSARSAELTD